MPSIRKRIGYLPSINAQQTITKIAKKEKLSQSKVVGILVEEALMARVGFDLKNTKNLIDKNLYCKENNICRMLISFYYENGLVMIFITKLPILVISILFCCGS